MQVISEFKGFYRFLSNFWPSPIVTLQGAFPTVEHAYQASKTHYPEEIERIRNARTPGMAKRIGRLVPQRQDWHTVRYHYMYNFVSSKFNDHETLGKLLIATGDAELIEDNNWNDTYWGICNGFGENNLGKILMQVRHELNQKT